MRKVFFFLLLISFCHVTAQQNLVPNPSFEDFSSCPTTLSQVNLAIPWFDPNQGTSDYYNKCYVDDQNSWVDVPTNSAGYQYARTGNAYVGVGTELNNATIENREYVEVKLKEKLKKGYKYAVEYYTCLDNENSCAVDAMGAHLSNDSLTENHFFYFLDAIPQIINPQGNILKDTLNWIKIGGEYISQGGEQFLTIGNFIKNAQNKIDTLPGHQQFQGYMAYYYVDDVSVVCLNCDSDTTKPTNNLFIPDAFSPNGDGNNDKLFVRGNNIQELYFAVYDRWGEKVFETTDKNIGWDGTYKGSTISGAVFVYYSTGKYTDGKEFKQKGDVMLVR